MAYYSRWPAYVPVAKRQAKAEKAMAKLSKSGQLIQPIKRFNNRKIAKTFWGASWCEHLEQFSDYANRLPRGRTYVRNGSVCHLEILKGEVKAVVSGSSLYHIHIKIAPLAKNHWNQVKKDCSGQIGSMLELLAGHFSDHVMGIVTDANTGLFPSSKQIKLACDCPDWAGLCKHLAAVLYGVGVRLDEQPELLFLLRGVDSAELVDAEFDVQATTNNKGTRRRVGQKDLGALFDIDIEETPRPRKKKVVSNPVVKKASPVKKSSVKKQQPKLRPFNATAASVKRLRKKFAMTVLEFANLVGVSSASIVNWERQIGKLYLQQRSQQALDKVCGLTSDQAWRRLKRKQ